MVRAEGAPPHRLLITNMGAPSPAGALATEMQGRHLPHCSGTRGRYVTVWSLVVTPSILKPDPDLVVVLGEEISTSFWYLPALFPLIPSTIKKYTIFDYQALHSCSSPPFHSSSKLGEQRQSKCPTQPLRFSSSSSPSFVSVLSRGLCDRQRLTTKSHSKVFADIVLQSHLLVFS